MHVDGERNPAGNDKRDSQLLLTHGLLLPLIRRPRAIMSIADANRKRFSVMVINNPLRAQVLRTARPPV
jgi:hypothetical protein